MKKDFREPTVAKKAPRAVADDAQGVILCVSDVNGTPEQVFNALTTNEVEKWWQSDVYFQKDWKADLRPCGAWSVAVQWQDGSSNRGFGEFCELSFPHKIVMTRRFDKHPFQGDRETTITYRLEPSPYGTRVTIREEGFIGRSQAAYGNAEVWEKVMGWLDGYLSGNH